MLHSVEMRTIERMRDRIAELLSWIEDAHHMIRILRVKAACFVGAENEAVRLREVLLEEYRTFSKFSHWLTHPGRRKGLSGTEVEDLIEACDESAKRIESALERGK